MLGSTHMPRPAKTERNKKVVFFVRRLKYSFGEVAAYFDISRSTVAEIYWREVGKRDKKKVPKYIQSKYRIFSKTTANKKKV